jgi:hypothetical protein
MFSGDSGPLEPSNPLYNEPSTEFFENGLNERYRTIWDVVNSFI